MSRMADHAAEQWELEDLNQLDPSQEDMDGGELRSLPAEGGYVHISEHSTNPVQTTTTAACQKPGMNGALSSEGAAASSRAFSFVALAFAGAPGRRWTSTSIHIEVPHVD